LFSFLSLSPVSPNPNPLHYDEKEAPTALRQRRSTHRTTLSTSIPHHSTTGSTPFNHRTHDVNPPTPRATEPPISTDQDRSTEKRAQLKLIKTLAESTFSFTDVDPSTGRHPSSIHGRSELILLLPLLDEGRRVTERDEDESEREREIINKKSLNT
jgi:hypothetical protein